MQVGIFDARKRLEDIFTGGNHSKNGTVNAVPDDRSWANLPAKGTSMNKLLNASAFLLVAAVIAAGANSTAFAQGDDDAMTSPPAPAKTTPPGPGAPPSNGQGGFLSCPAVPAGAAQGDGVFGSGDGKRGNAGDRFMAGVQEVRIFREAMASVLPSLSQEQRTEIEKLAADFMIEAQRWRTANADKIREFQEKMGGTRPGGKGGQPGKGGDAGSPPPAKGDPANKDQARQRPDKAMMEEMAKLKSTMPKFEPVREKIMAILSPEQQAEVKQAFGKLRDKQGPDGKGRAGKGGKGGADAPAKAPPPADPPKGDYKFAD